MATLFSAFKVLIFETKFPPDFHVQTDYNILVHDWSLKCLFTTNNSQTSR